MSVGGQGPDHYQTLGVERGATAVEVKGAYRRLALKWHPDRNAGDAAAEERFKEVSEAYAILGDEDKRAHYDRFGGLGDGAFPFGGDADVKNATEFFNTVFGDLFGIGRKRAAGHDLRYTLEVEFEEAALGCEKAITFDRQEDCRACQGSGAEGGAAGLTACAACGGQGTIRHKAGLLGGRRECRTCGGSGEVPRVRCSACTGTGLAERQREYVVRVPPGSVDGTAQRVPGEGSPGRRGGPAGDLHVMVRVRAHDFFRIEAGVFVCEVPVTAVEVALGAEIEVPLCDTVVRMKIPAGTQPGTLFRLRGKGLPQPGGPRGDAHVRVMVETPVHVTPEVEEGLRSFARSLNDSMLPRRSALAALVAARAAAMQESAHVHE